MKNVTIEKETGKILRTGSKFLAPVMGLETAATAIRSSNFQFTEGQAMGLCLEQLYTSSEEGSTNLRESGLDTVESAYILLMTTSRFGPNTVFQIFSESLALFCIFSLKR